MPCEWAGGDATGAVGGDGGAGGDAATVLGRKLQQTFKTAGGNGGNGGAAANFGPVTGGNGGNGKHTLLGLTCDLHVHILSIWLASWNKWTIQISLFFGAGGDGGHR